MFDTLDFQDVKFLTQLVSYKKPIGGSLENLGCEKIDARYREQLANRKSIGEIPEGKSLV